MWLPTPIYERIPQFWLLLGLLFMSSGTYLGFDYGLSFLYFGVGFVCSLWSLWIFSLRAHARRVLRQKQKEERLLQHEAAEAAKAEQQSANELAQGASLPAA
jgi:threonine/homoserine/homoserine lactone efflux protein